VALVTWELFTYGDEGFSREVVGMPDVRPTLLALLIAGDERTQEEIVEGFERWARDNGEDATLSLRTLRRWMIGDVRTKPRPAQRRVARAYWGYSMDDLLGPPPSQTPPAAAPEEAGEAVVVAASEADGSFAIEPIAKGGQSPLERQVAMSTRRATRFTSYAESRNVGPEALATLAEEIGGLAGDYIREPVINVIGDLIEAQETVFTLLEAQQRPPEARDLYMLASVVSGMIAKASHDLGRSHDAMTHARTMFVCADNADHLSLRAWARGLQSLIAYWAGRMQEAVRYAEAGAMFTGDLRGSVTAWLPALEARAWAQLGQTADARAAVERARDRRDQIIPDELDSMGGLMAFPLAKQHYYAAGTYVYLGDDDDVAITMAETEANSALELYADPRSSDWSFSDQAGARAELALARVHRGELAGAKDALGPVLALEPDRRIGGILASANRVHQALREARFARAQEATDLREEIESFSTRSAARLSA
jgi:tetratricopeptide (TPR) repeat protein